MEGQGWLAWFISSLVFNHPITIYGNGKQVRDILHVNDLVNAFDLAFKNIKKTKGKAYTIGGGPNTALSILEFFQILEKISSKRFNYKLKPWRLADQKVYISDISSAKKDFNWSPKILPKEGIKKLYEWTQKNKDILTK
jgi:CDP-paratose 2-epimerase